jgi:hypothetical protein
MESVSIRKLSLTFLATAVFLGHLISVVSLNLPHSKHYLREGKRITIVFRGTVMGGKDWGTNVNGLWGALETPEMLKELGFDEKKKIKVHNGFKSKFFDTN